MEPGAIERTRGLTRGFCELTLETRDPASLAGFYTDIFGWTELSRHPDRIWIECGERSRLGLWSNQLVRELTERGVPHEGPVEHDGGDRSVYFKDPEGNVVEAWDFFEQGEGGRDGVDALR